jgi:hypothetical protein
MLQDGVLKSEKRAPVPLPLICTEIVGRCPNRKDVACIFRLIILALTKGRGLRYLGLRAWRSKSPSQRPGFALEIRNPLRTLRMLGSVDHNISF